METQEAVSTLSGTAFGAIIVLMAVGFSAGFVMMARYIRQLTKQLMEISEKRIQDANDLHEKSQKILIESMEMTNKASRALEDHRKKICTLDTNCGERIKKIEEGFSELRRETLEKLDCRKCPARAQALGD